MVFECIAKSIGCKVGGIYIGKIRNKFAIDIKNEIGKIWTYDITKFRIIDEDNDDDIEE